MLPVPNHSLHMKANSDSTSIADEQITVINGRWKRFDRNWRWMRWNKQTV